MWVPKLLISPVIIRIFCPKPTKFGPNLAFLSIAGSFGALLVGWLVFVARAASRKTPIYFMKVSNAEHPCCTDKIVSGNAIIVVIWEMGSSGEANNMRCKRRNFNLSFCQEFFYFLFHRKIYVFLVPI